MLRLLFKNLYSVFYIWLNSLLHLAFFKNVEQEGRQHSNMLCVYCIRATLYKSFARRRHLFSQPHSPSLPGARLAIYQQTWVDDFKKAVKKRFHRNSVNLFLASALREDLVEIERDWVVS